MNKQFLMNRIIQFGKSNRFTKFVALVLVFFVSLFFNSFKTLYRNRIKLVAMTLSIIIATLYVNYCMSFNKFIIASESVGVNEEGELLFAGDIVYSEPEITNENDISNINEPAAFYTDNEKYLSGFDYESWELIIVNEDNVLENEPDFNLVPFYGYEIDSRILENATNMFNDAKKENINLFVSSGYRDFSTQQYLFNNKVNQFRYNGYSLEEATIMASKRVALPNTSEHQTGLALDILSYKHKTMDKSFSESEAGIWLSENSYKYGFILRYPEGKEDITHIQFEPWHFRYVGLEAAKYIHDNNICFEEFINLIQKACNE